MYPRPFAYERATTIDGAVEALASSADAKVLAGGQSLVPMLSLGLASPALLVDVNALDLAGIEQREGKVVIGALTRHRELEQGAVAAELLPLLREAAGRVGNPRVRNRGTFGGSLSHADPGAELVAVALAHGGSVVLHGPGGERSIAVDEYLLGYFETAASPDELLVRVELDALPAGAGTGFLEVSERAGDFATSAAAAVVTLADDGATCAEVRLVVIGGSGRAERLVAAEAACRGTRLDAEVLTNVARIVGAAVNPEDDPFISAAHRRRCATHCATRALLRAMSRAGGAA